MWDSDIKRWAPAIFLGLWVYLLLFFGMASVGETEQAVAPPQADLVSRGAAS